MATIHQVNAIANSMTDQILGRTTVTPTDSTFVSVGAEITQSDNLKDAFYKVLYDRIGRTVLALREVEDDVVTMDREPFEYGTMLQKLSFKSVNAQENPAWRALSEEHTDPFKKSVMTIRQTMFHGISTWEVPGTLPDEQLKTAFTNPQAMAAFIDGIFLNMKNSMQLKYNGIAYLVRASAIAAVHNSKNTVVNVDLLSSYNTYTGSSLTQKAALIDPEFLRYSGRLIRLYSERLKKTSTTFNPIGWERRTPKDRQVIEVLADLATAYETYLQSDVWHNELTKMPNFTIVPYWQSSGTAWDFTSTSSIDVVIESTNEGGTTEDVDVQVNGVVAVIRDIDAIATTIDDRKVRSIFNPHDEYSNYWYKANIGYMRDISENFVVFTMSETTTTIDSLSANPLNLSKTELDGLFKDPEDE